MRGKKEIILPRNIFILKNFLKKYHRSIISCALNSITYLSILVKHFHGWTHIVMTLTKVTFRIKYWKNIYSYVNRGNNTIKIGQTRDGWEMIPTKKTQKFLKFSNSYTIHSPAYWNSRPLKWKCLTSRGFFCRQISGMLTPQRLICI